MDEGRLLGWLKTRDRAEGVAIYEALAGSGLKLDLVKRFDNEYTNGLIEQLVEDHLQKVKATASIEAVREQPSVKADFFSLPETLQRLSLEKGELYRQAIQKRRELKAVIWDDLKRHIKTRTRLTVKECCDMMKHVDQRGRPVPFSVSFVTLNKEAKTGGELIFYEHATLVMPNRTGSRQYTATKYDQMVFKNPRHWLNSTRNIRPLASDQTRKLHIWLIFEFNGCEVVMGDTA